MTSPQKISRSFQTTQWIIDNQTKGLSHADSLLQLPFRANCMNWVVGHLVAYRDRIVGVLGQEPLLSEVETELYERGSAPITDGEKAVSFEKLLRLSNQSYKQITAYLEEASPNALEVIHNAEKQQTLADRLQALHWHETYHVGQLEILRQLAGTDDVVIP